MQEKLSKQNISSPVYYSNLLLMSIHKLSLINTVSLNILLSICNFYSLLSKSFSKYIHTYTRATVKPEPNLYSDKFEDFYYQLFTVNSFEKQTLPMTLAINIKSKRPANMQK